MITLFVASFCLHFLQPSHAASALNASYHDWQSLSTPTIQTQNRAGAAVSYGEQQIWFLGGVIQKEALLSYNIETKKFTSHGDTWLSESLFGRAQYYTQLNNLMYIIHNGSFIQFDTSTKTATYNYKSISTAASSGACLASMTNYLFVMGQGSGTDIPIANTVQIINLQTNQWLSNVPDMNSARSQSACITNGRYLYVIGGSGGTVYYDTVEILDISNIKDGFSGVTWKMVEDTLSHKVFGPRAVNYRTDILVIGGTEIPSWERIEDINVIDTLSNTLRVEDGFGIGFGTNVPSIMVDDVVYVFTYVTQDIWYMDLSEYNANAKPTTSKGDVGDVDTETSASASASKPSGIMEFIERNVIYVVIGAGVVLICIIVICVYCRKRSKQTYPIGHKKYRKTRTTKLQKPRKTGKYKETATLSVQSTWEINENADEDDHAAALDGWHSAKSSVNDVSMRKLKTRSQEKLESVFDESDHENTDSSDNNLENKSDFDRLTVDIADAKTNQSGHVNVNQYQ